MKPKPAIIFHLNLVLIFNLLLLNGSFVNCHFASNLFNRFANWQSAGIKSTSLINLQSNLHSIQRKATDYSNRTVSARSGNYASVARRLSQVGNHAAGILEFGKLLQQLSQLDVTKLPLNAKLARALQTLTKSKLLTGLSALNELQERYGSNHLAIDTLGGNLNNFNKTLVAAAALRTLLGSALTHARHSSDEKASDKPGSFSNLLTSLVSLDSSKDSTQPSYTIEDNPVSSNVISNVIGTGPGLSGPDLNTIKTWFMKLSQLALPDRQSALADDPKQLNAALWSLINLARYFLCKYLF